MEATFQVELPFDDPCWIRIFTYHAHILIFKPKSHIEPTTCEHKVQVVRQPKTPPQFGVRDPVKFQHPEALGIFTDRLLPKPREDR
ncbi:hypothetical protein HO173_005590 [Letharia columbiana]|uniref:Uncharacterized protein n=1 Tax=Letharia columbiana TaxID=112416 RepID=A0A8H6FWG1_9LECA|nr:uncharacterized protein HO173_005590 [Letharia columbiana]KAF6235962.1 hypothetical protein HO173_005590 [Letharia columbiana]